MTEQSPESVAPEQDSGATQFTFTASDGTVVVFPIDVPQPNKKWLWNLYGKPFLHQTFEWMNLAGVSPAVQETAVSIPDDDYLKLFTEWFKEMGGSTPGE